MSHSHFYFSKLCILFPVFVLYCSKVRKEFLRIYEWINEMWTKRMKWVHTHKPLPNPTLWLWQRRKVAVVPNNSKYGSLDKIREIGTTTGIPTSLFNIAHFTFIRLEIPEPNWNPITFISTSSKLYYKYMSCRFNGEKSITCLRYAVIKYLMKYHQK